MEILIDTRERAIKDEYFIDAMKKKDLSGYDISIKRLQMTTSDFAVCYKGNILLLIERKTWKDLAATIKDASRRTNYEKMLQAKSEHKTCMKIIYLIEGAFITDRSTKIQRMAFSSLRSHLDHLMYNHDIHTVYSRNKADTAYRLLELAKNIMNMKNNILKSMSGGAEIEAEKVLTKKQHNDDQIIEIQIIKAVKGVSETVACLLVENGIHISNLLSENQSDKIKGIKYPSGRYISSSKATKLSNSFTSIYGLKIDEANDQQQKDMIKIVSAIPGVSKKTARLLLSHYSISEMTKKNKSNLSNLQMTEKRKIGPALTKKLIKFINM